MKLCNLVGMAVTTSTVVAVPAAPDSIVLALCVVESRVVSAEPTMEASDPLPAVTTIVICVLEPDGVKLSVTKDAGTPSDAATDAVSAALLVASKEDGMPDSSIELSTS